MKIVIVGAGLAGATAARLCLDVGHEVDVFETRNHIAGNCYDAVWNGMVHHVYGPHIFHTHKRKVWEFANRFDGFRSVAWTCGAITAAGMLHVPLDESCEHRVKRHETDRIIDLIFRDYCRKQWGEAWENLPPAITKRVPLFREGGGTYLSDPYVGVPVHGYTAWIGAMLEGARIHLGCDPDDWRRVAADRVIYTGSLDEYFRNQLGRLPYRSVEIEWKRRPAQTMSAYPHVSHCTMDEPWTRMFDHGLFYGMRFPSGYGQPIEWDPDFAPGGEGTLVSIETPCEWEPGLVRAYPKPWGVAEAKAIIYREMARAEVDTIFVGRLATYRYMDMDDVISQVAMKLRPLTI